MKIVLASASPRRRLLMEMLGVRELEVIPSLGEETVRPEWSPRRTVESLSRAKAGADTVVELDGAILGKPRDEEDAFRMLRSLSGREHRVYTGVTAISPERSLTRSERTAVTFRALSDGEIRAYIATGEPMDKAGAYGIQGIGSLFIPRVEGDYFNVMGLPLCLMGTMLRELGVHLL